MATTIGILQPSYLPWLGYLEQIARCDVFVLYDDVQFDKGGWRNRNRIKTPNGPLWLTVPVLTKGSAMPLVKDIRINNVQHWAKSHLKTLAQYYSKSPFYRRYHSEITDILTQQWESLALLDRAVIEWMCACFGIDTPMYWSSDLDVAGDRLERLLAIINHFGGNRFYEGAAGRNYIPVDWFAQRGVEVVFQDYHHPTYSQLHGPFISHLSALDLLYNEGSRARDVLLHRESGT